jgi:formylglycine-generating enzyme required for sulfatase activity
MSKRAEYALERLWEDSEFVLSREVRQDGSAPVLMLAPASEQPAPEIVRRLEYAYSLRHELDSAWAVRPLELVHHDGRPALELEDPGSNLLEVQLRQPMELAPPENLVAGSVVFTPTSEPVSLDNHYQWWSYVKGANWRHPEGPQSDIKGKENYPVVQIAYPDAVAYAKWADKRLPTEAEWEFAARGGLSGKLYAWGDEFKPGGKFMANTYQGVFPVKDTGEDGFAGTSPVGAFPANGHGLYDMAGNVWQWCSDWYRPDYFKQLVDDGNVARNPQGPEMSFDPAEPTEKKRVQKGGSFLCTDRYCTRYMMGTRGKGEVNTGTDRVGFQCVLAP